MKQRTYIEVYQQISKSVQTMLPLLDYTVDQQSESQMNITYRQKQDPQNIELIIRIDDQNIYIEPNSPFNIFNIPKTHAYYTSRKVTLRWLNGLQYDGISGLTKHYVKNSNHFPKFIYDPSLSDCTVNMLTQMFKDYAYESDLTDDPIINNIIDRLVQQIVSKMNDDYHNKTNVLDDNYYENIEALIKNSKDLKSLDRSTRNKLFNIGFSTSDESFVELTKINRLLNPELIRTYYILTETIKDHNSRRNHT